MGFFGWLFSDWDKPASRTAFEKLHSRMFPSGQQDVDRLTNAIAAAASGALTRSQAREIGLNLKTLHHISGDASAERLLASIKPKTPSLTDEQRRRVVLAVMSDGLPAMAVGDGASPERPIRISATCSAQGIDAEYRVLEGIFGLQNVGWTLLYRAHGPHDGRYLEWFVVRPARGPQRTVYFDISSFFGR